MKTILLLCNEQYETDVRNWIAEVQEYLKDGITWEDTWSCGRVRNIQVGDRVFLQRTGQPPRGYFASGRTIVALDQLRLKGSAYQNLSEAYENAFYNDSFKVYFEIDTIVNYDYPLEISYLETLPQFNGCTFIRYQGGTALGANYEDFLEQEWEKHTLSLSKRGLGVRLIDTYCKNAAENLREQEYDEAYDLYNAALELRPNYPKAIIGLGNVLTFLENYNEAITEYTKAIALQTTFDKVAYFKRGTTYSNLGNHQLAINDFKESIEIDNNFLEAWLSLGNELYKIGQYDEAIEVYTKAIAINPNKAVPYVKRGKAFRKLAKFQSAREDWQKALEIEPSLNDTVTSLLRSLEQNDSTDASSSKSKSSEDEPYIEKENEDTTIDQGDLDIGTINPEFKDITGTARRAVVNARIGQGQFRRKVIEYWNMCSITGCRNHSLLKASHIKPWSQCSVEEALDPFNGLLLTPSLDAAFDSGYITFDELGNIEISKQLNENDAETLGIRSSLRLSRIDSNHQKYLIYHRQNIFKSDESSLTSCRD